MSLHGNEIIYVQGIAENNMPAATQFPTTTGAIAALANSEVTDTVNTAITTVGNGTLTAAALAGGVITRSGPSAVFTDTTATAAQIYAQLGSITSVSFLTRIKNTTAFAQTLSAGSGVTLPTSVVIPANSVGTYLVTVNTSTTATFVHVQTTPLTSNTLEVSTTLSTVGAGTITAAGIAGGVTNRTGSQSGTPFTDTTATADLIIAAAPNANIGQSWEYTYKNSTNAVATLAGGVGVTVSGVTVVPANSFVRYLITYTAASTITAVAILQGYFPSKGTVILNGATPVTVSNAAVTVGSIVSFTLKTIGGTVSPNAPNVLTITAGTGFTVAGTALDSSTYNYEIRG